MDANISPKRLLQQALVSVARISEEDAKAVVEEGSANSFRQLKVTELKDVIKTLKNAGYYHTHLSLTANKPQLIEMLVNVANVEGPKGTQSATNSAVRNQRVHGPAASAHPPGPFSSPAVAGGSIPAQRASFPLPSSSNKKAKYQHAPSSSSGHKLPNPTVGIAYGGGSSSNPGSGHKAHSSQPPHPSLNSQRKIQAYRTLKAVPGVTEAEIIAELKQFGPSEDIDEDMVLFNIVTKRTGDEPQIPSGDGDMSDAQYAALLEQENRDVDRAIMESEKERDVIQQRKRNRVEELRSGKDGYLTSPEFQTSVLLRGCGGDGSEEATNVSATPGVVSGAPCSPVPTRSVGASNSSAVAAGSMAQAAQAGKVAQSEVVDLTCDSSPEHSPAPAVWGAFASSAYAGSPTKKVANGLIGGNSVRATPRKGTQTVQSGFAAKAVDLSRSKVLYPLAQLLDDVAALVGSTGAQSGANGTSSSSSSSSGSSSSSSGNRKLTASACAVYDASQLYDDPAQRLVRVVQQLRPVVARLLLLEVNAAKFYPKVSCPYLLFLARKLDCRLACTTVDDARRQLQLALDANTGTATSSSGTAGLTSAPPTVEPCILSLPGTTNTSSVYVASTQLVNVLTRECNKFERGLYKLPTDGNMVPAILRKPKLGCFERALASRIETDGIEFIASPDDQGTSVGTSAVPGSVAVAKPVAAAVLMDTSTHYFSSSEESQWSQPSSYHSSDSEY